MILKHVDFEVPGFGELATGPAVAPDYQQAIADLAPIADWQLEEVAGTTLADSTGSHDLQLSGGYSLGVDGPASAPGSSAVFFSGGSADATGAVIPASTPLPFSVVFWAQQDASAVSGSIIGQHSTSESGSLLILMGATGQLLFSIGSLFFLTTGSIDQTWRHVVLTHDGLGTVSWYIDGAIDNTVSGTAFSVADVPFALGQQTFAGAFAMLDSVSVLPSALTSGQVSHLFALAKAWPSHLAGN